VIVSVDPSLAGYDAAHTSSFYRAALDRVRSVAGVEHASLASIVPFGEFQEGRTVRIKASDDGSHADLNIISSEYFETLGMNVLRGRGFNRAEEQPGAGIASVVVDRPLVKKLFGDDDPLGRQILVSGREGEASTTHTIVGVVSEMRHDVFDIDPRPHVFIPTGSLYRGMMTFHIRTAAGAPETAVLATVNPELHPIATP